MAVNWTMTNVAAHLIVGLAKTTRQAAVNLFSIAPSWNVEKHTLISRHTNALGETDSSKREEIFFPLNPCMVR